MLTLLIYTALVFSGAGIWELVRRSYNSISPELPNLLEQVEWLPIASVGIEKRYDNNEYPTIDFGNGIKLRASFRGRREAFIDCNDITFSKAINCGNRCAIPITRSQRKYLGKIFTKRLTEYMLEASTMKLLES